MIALGTRGLEFRYRAGQVPIFAGVDLTVPRGSLTALTGASGSGKSTLLYVLALMLRPTSGDVLWDGRPVQGLPDGTRARLRASSSGFVFQDAMLDPTRTVLDNVCEAALYAGLSLQMARRRGRQLLDEMGVGHRADGRPGEVSGGQAQRVALCRALVTGPKVVFGDEPTGNLDDDAAELVWSVLRDRADSGCTVVVATHDQRLAGQADHRIDLG